jgi:site-specific DNA-methyltransferase (adenine-specific)
VIVNDDALSYTKTMQSESVDLIIIDPPYVDVVKDIWDSKDVVTEELAYELRRVLKSTGSLYLWCGIGEKSQSLMRWYPVFAKHFVFKDMITWKKSRGIGMRKGWLYTREEILWFVKDNKQFVWNEDAQYGDERRIWDGGSDTPKPSQTGTYAKSIYKRLTNVWIDIQEESLGVSLGVSKEILHSTPKPIKALKRIIEAHTTTGDIVYDCFLGSGSTAVACLQTGRSYIGVELDITIYNIASKRIESLTNRLQPSLM